MIKIRLKRLGRKKRPFFRIVVMNVQDRREGAPIEELGFYNPLSRELKINKEAAQTWINKGAQLTPTVKRLMQKAPDLSEVVVLEKRVKKVPSEKDEVHHQQKVEAEPEAAAAE